MSTSADAGTKVSSSYLVPDLVFPNLGAETVQIKIPKALDILMNFVASIEVSLRSYIILKNRDYEARTKYECNTSSKKIYV